MILEIVGSRTVVCAWMFCKLFSSLSADGSKMSSSLIYHFYFISWSCLYLPSGVLAEAYCFQADNSPAFSQSK